MNRLQSNGFMRTQTRANRGIAAFAFCAVVLVLGCCRAPIGVPFQDATGSELCSSGYAYIPEGNFEMGLGFDDSLYGLEIQIFWDMAPRRTVFLSGYCIQMTEVTVASYRACRQAGICTAEIRDRDEYGTCNYAEEQLDRDNHPMNCVTREGAREYCQQWEGGDLPSDAQWEKAARGTDQRLFPWGNTMFTCDLANWDSNGPTTEDSGYGAGCAHSRNPATWEVGTIPSAGDSPYGLKDMSGNVEEFVLECFDLTLIGTCPGGPCVDPVHICDVSSLYTARGGSSGDFVWGILTVVAHTNPNPLSAYVGFRCARPLTMDGGATGSSR
jgi:eukaryotic-like serine/threonine-protein kinase